MGQYFWHCPVCNGNFDPDEKCDCVISISNLKEEKNESEGSDTGASRRSKT